MTDTNWRDRATCRSVDADLFFPETTGEALDDACDEPLVRRQVEAAKAVCRRCPVRERCLVEALERLPYGVAGGMTAQERRRVRAHRVRPGERKPRWLALLEAGSSHREVAAEYGVSARTIARWAAAHQLTGLPSHPTVAELPTEQATRAGGGGPG